MERAKGLALHQWTMKGRHFKKSFSIKRTCWRGKEGTKLYWVLTKYQILYSCFLLTWILLISFRDEEICSRGSIDFIYQSRLIWIEIFLTPKLCPLYDGASEYAQSVLIFSRDKHTRPQTTDFLSLALWHDSAAGKFQPLPCPRIKQELSIWKQTVQQVKGSQQKIG